MIATIAPSNTRPPTTPPIVAPRAVLSGGLPLLLEELVVAEDAGPPVAWRVFLGYSQPNSGWGNRTTYVVALAWPPALEEDVVWSALEGDEVSADRVVVVEVGLFWGGPFPWPSWARRIRMLICSISNVKEVSVKLQKATEWIQQLKCPSIELYFLLE